VETLAYCPARQGCDARWGIAFLRPGLCFQRRRHRLGLREL